MINPEEITKQLVKTTKALNDAYVDFYAEINYAKNLLDTTIEATQDTLRYWIDTYQKCAIEIANITPNHAKQNPQCPDEIKHTKDYTGLTLIWWQDGLCERIEVTVTWKEIFQYIHG